MDGKSKKDQSMTTVTEELGITHIIVSLSFKAFQTTVSVVRRLSSCCSGQKIAANDRYLVLQSIKQRRKEREQSQNEQLNVRKHFSPCLRGCTKVVSLHNNMYGECH